MKKVTPSRRQFLGTFATGAAATGLGVIPSILQATIPMNTALTGDAKEWLEKGIKGTHRVVYDASAPNEAFPIIWTWAYYFTSNNTGIQDSDMTAVCIFRHEGIPFAMNDAIWAKYKFGEFFHVTDNLTKAPAVRNPYYEPKEGDFPMPMIQGIHAMQDRGALFGVCDLALTVVSGVVAQSMGLDGAAVKAEWVAGICPGIQVVPSGVWALGLAQELGCGYIYAGG